MSQVTNTNRRTDKPQHNLPL